MARRLQPVRGQHFIWQLRRARREHLYIAYTTLDQDNPRNYLDRTNTKRKKDKTKMVFTLLLKCQNRIHVSRSCTLWDSSVFFFSHYVIDSSFISDTISCHMVISIRFDIIRSYSWKLIQLHAAKLQQGSQRVSFFILYNYQGRWRLCTWNMHVKSTVLFYDNILLYYCDAVVHAWE